jgi:hypothetical protein
VNHYKMAKMICRRMEGKGMRLRAFPFILGNLVPDLCLSFLFRRHEYACSALFLRKISLRLYEGRFDPPSAAFAYFMGIAGHYICDYFCYSHSPAFRGNLWDHIRYEWVQPMPGAEAVSACEPEQGAMGFSRLMDTLDACIRRHDRDLRGDAAAAKTDIAMGTAAAGWLTEAVFRSAEQRLEEEGLEEQRAPIPAAFVPVIIPALPQD